MNLGNLGTFVNTAVKMQTCKCNIRTPTSYKWSKVLSTNGKIKSSESVQLCSTLPTLGCTVGCSVYELLGTSFFHQAPSGLSAQIQRCIAVYSDILGWVCIWARRTWQKLLQPRATPSGPLFLRWLSWCLWVDVKDPLSQWQRLPWLLAPVRQPHFPAYPAKKKKAIHEDTNKLLLSTLSSISPGLCVGAVCAAPSSHIHTVKKQWRAEKLAQQRL